ncbi:MAG TPA: glycosyltransferase family 4 protein [Beijerinckiaceae bacterium]|nr:glycosyltransferase family 4 protein [Beijerinckiaceae bacterium]
MSEALNGGDRARLRVLCVTPVGLDGMGGIDRLYCYLRQHAAETGAPDDVVINYFASRGPASGLKSILGFPLRFLSFAWKMATGGYDIVHLNHSTDGSALRKWALGSVAKAFGVRLSTHFHGMIEESAYRTRPLWLAALRSLSAKSDRIVILGDYFSGEFRDRLGIPSEKLTVIHNGIPDFSADLPLPKPVRPTRLILFAGEVGPRKGAGLLLEALAILRQRAPGWRCVMAGNGDIHEYKAMAAMLGLKDRVSFTGWVGSDEVHALMREADVVVLPSRVEALPLSLIEGACAGAALVSSMAGASGDITVDGRNGHIVPLESEAIAGALAGLINDPQRLAAMQLESRALFVERFRIEQFARAFRAMLLSLANRPEPVVAPTVDRRAPA